MRSLCYCWLFEKRIYNASKCDQTQPNVGFDDVSDFLMSQFSDVSENSLHFLKQLGNI